MSWDRVAQMLVEGVDTGTFCGAAAGIQIRDRRPRIFVVGKTREGADGEEITGATLFDLASLTKVLATATVFARLTDRGLIDLDDAILKAFLDLPWHADWKKATVRQTLAHCAGFAAWKDFAGPLAQKGVPAGSVAARKEMLAEISATAPVAPPGEKTVYSDLGFLLLGEWLERVTGKSLARWFEEEVREPLGCASLTWRPGVEGISLKRIAATEDDPARGGVIHGTVHDHNAQMWGDLAGHAGLFGPVEDCLKIARTWLMSQRNGTPYLSSAMAQLYTTPIDSSVSSRGLGWDVPAPEGSLAGEKVSRRAVGHLGYTGTSLWIDFTRESSICLLTNRIHPSSRNNKIKAFRPRFHDRVWETIDE